MTKVEIIALAEKWEAAARRAETEMNRILRRAAALGMQYGEYMIYLETQKEKSHEEQELRQHPSDGPGSHRGAGGL